MRGGLLGCVIAFALLAAPEGEAAVSVWPVEIHLYSAPDEEAHARFQLTNRSGQEQEVHLSLTDWAPGEGEGDGAAAGAGRSLPSLIPFVTAGPPSTLRLGPGESTAMTVQVRRPPGDQGTRWLGISLLSRPLHQGREDPRSPRLLRRQRLRLYHTPLPLEPARGEIRGIFPPGEGPEGSWRVVYVNATERVFSVAGEWRLTDPTGRDVAHGFFAPFRAYPGERSVSFGPLPPLLPGIYHLLVLLRPEEGEAAAGRLIVRAASEKERWDP